LFKVLFLFILLLSFPLNVFSDSIRPQDPNLPGISKTDKEVTKYLKEVTTRMDYWTGWLERLSPKYVWGGVGIAKGGDCSGQVYWVCHMSGLPYLRTTAFQMWNGAWPGEVIKSWKTSAFPNLIYFTFSEKRPAGHVGIIRKNYHPDYLIFAEASSSAKRFKRTIIESDTNYEKTIIGIQKLDLTMGFKTVKPKK
jgi:hypothetical protein